MPTVAQPKLLADRAKRGQDGGGMTQHTANRSEGREARGDARVAALFVALAMLLGGGGTPNPAAEIALESLAVLFGAVWLFRGQGRAMVEADRSIIAIAMLLLAIPALQLVPLPRDLWQSLPGRQDVARSLAAIGEADTWRPFSISPPRTLASLVSLGPPILAMLMVARLDNEGRRTILLAISVMGLAAAGLGAVQLGAGNAAPRLYEFSHSGVITGFHANRNAAADVFLVAILASSAWLAGARMGRAGNRIALFIACLFVLVAATALTGSRTGIALLPLALLGCWLAWRRDRSQAAPGNRWFLAIGGLFMAALVWIVATSDRIGEIARRFDFSSDFRVELWRDAADALARYWPWGSGVGTASIALIASERLEVVDETMPNRVHNDYFEWVVEAGLPGALVLVLTALLVVRLVVRAARSGAVPRNHLLFAAFALVILAAHSLIDYPLRSMALAALAGVACGMLAPSRPVNR